MSLGHPSAAIAIAAALFFTTTLDARAECEPTRLQVVLGRGHATVTERIALFNPRETTEEVERRITLPEWSAVIGLRASDDGRWFRARLLPAELAAITYGRFTGRAGRLPDGPDEFEDDPWIIFSDRSGDRDPALAVWATDGVGLQVYPVEPRSSRAIELTWTTLLQLVDGRYVLDLRRYGEGLDCLARLDVRTEHARDRVFVRGALIDERPHIRLMAADGSIVLEPVDVPLVDATLASVELDEHRVVHWTVRLRNELAQPPKHADVVVVIDESASLRDHSKSATEAAVAYLDALIEADVSARVQVISFDREVRRHFEEPVTAKVASADLVGHTVKSANGSALDAALREAADWFARFGRPGATRRIVVLTDLRTASDFDAVRGAELIARTGALAHVGLIGSAERPLEPDFDHTWSWAIESSGGLVWRGNSFNESSVVTEWVRPQQLFDPRVQILASLPVS